MSEHWPMPNELHPPVDPEEQGLRADDGSAPERYRHGTIIATPDEGEQPDAELDRSA